MRITYQCPRCGYATEFGNAARIALHETASHESGAPIVGIVP
jgi:hypothetical protein